MPIIYRHQKGGPLTFQEVDENFHEIVSRLEALEQKSSHGESIATIVQKGDYLEIIGTHETLLGQFKLPVLRYGIRGNWNAHTAYAAQDVITREAQAWVCSVAHTSGSHFDARHWNLLLDVSTCLRGSESASQIPVFMKDTLPEPKIGYIGIYVTSNKTSPIYGDGKVWRLLQDQSILEKGL